MSPSRSSSGDTRPTDRARSASRAMALLVLVPAVLALVLSVLALAAFYLAPERFTALLERLPGTEFLRVVLIFSPATLFGVVLLAALYALEPAGPRPAEEPSIPRTGMPLPRLLASAVLAVSLPLLLLSSAGWVLSFVAPGRFELLVEPLPGTALLKAVLPYAPFLFLAASAGAALALAGGPTRRRLHLPDVTRWSVRLILFATLPLLGLTLGGLFLFYAQPEWGDRLVAKLGVTAFVKLGLVFGPAVLIALVVLASLYLARPRAADARVEDVSEAPIVPQPAGRRTWSTWAFISALAASSMMAVGVTLAVVYLLLR